MMDQSDDEYGAEEGQAEPTQDDALVRFGHADSVYCVDIIPVAPFNILVSGDGKDMALVWKLTELPADQQEESKEG